MKESLPSSVYLAQLEWHALGVRLFMNRTHSTASLVEEEIGVNMVSVT